MASVDIAIPSYNYARYLIACVESVLRQQDVSLRVLIIDNASTDGSADIARKLAASDPRIELSLRPRNLGPHASFNEAVDWAQGDYFAILCADDLLPNGALARAVRLMEQNPEVNLVYGRTEFVGPEFIAPPANAEPETGEIIPGRDLLERFCRTGRSPIGGPTAVVRTSVQKIAGHYLPDLRHTDDVEMWMRFSSLGATARLDAVQLYARIHDANQSAAVTDVRKWNREMEHAFDAFFSGAGARLDEVERLHRMARHGLADRAYWCAVGHLLRREPGAAPLLRDAVRLRPSLAVCPPLASLFAREDAAQRIRATVKAALARLAPSAVR